MTKTQKLNRKFGTKIPAIILAGLFAAIAFVFFHQGSLEALFSFGLNRSIKPFCPNCSVHLSNFKVSSQNLANFKINTSLIIQSNKTGPPILAIESLNLKFNLSKIVSAFSIPVVANVTSMHFDLDSFLKQGFNSKNLFNEKRCLLESESFEIRDAFLTANKIRYSFDLRKTTAGNLSKQILKLTSAGMTSEAEIIELDKNGVKTLEYKLQNLPAQLILMAVPSQYQNEFLNKFSASSFLSGEMKLQSSLKTKTLKANFYGQTKNSPEPTFTLALSSNNWLDNIQIKKLTIAVPISKEFQKTNSILSGEGPDSTQKSVKTRVHDKTEEDFLKDERSSNPGLISIKGHIKRFPKLLRQEISLSLSFEADELNLTSLYSLWPQGLAVTTKNWVNNSITTGKLHGLRGKIHVKDIFSSGSENISCSGQSKFQGLNLKYMPELPQIDGLAGLATFNNSDITFDISEGKMTNVNLDKGSTVKIDFKDIDHPVIVNTKAHGPLKDFINFISKENLLLLKNRKIDLQNIAGTAEADISLRIPLEKEQTLNNLGLEVNANLTEVRFSALDKLEINGPLTLNIHNHLLSIGGTPLINNKPAKFNWQTHLKDKMEFDNKLAIDTVLDASKEDLTLLYDKITVSKGRISTTAHYVGKGKNEKLTIHSNLDHPRIYIPDVNLTKEPNNKSNFDLILTTTDGQVWKTEKCDFSSAEDKISVASYAELSSTLDEVTKFDSIIKSKDNDLKINLTLNDTEGKFVIHGMHVVPDKNHLLQLLNSQHFSNNRKVSVHVDVDKATMKNGITFSKILGRFECHKAKCKNSSFSMKIDDEKNLGSTLSIYKRKKAFILRTNNAASFLKGLDAYSNIEGGSMIVTLRPPTKPPRLNIKQQPLKGDIYIRDFKALKTPLIAKLILMTPFTQIVEQLKGQDLIPFKSFRGAFVVENNRIKFQNAVASGDLIAVTINGYIDLKNKKLKLQGSLIPNCLVNKVISKIQDQKETAPRKYQISTNYTISGDLDNPQIHVNPISLLISLFTKPLAII